MRHWSSHGEVRRGSEGTGGVRLVVSWDSEKTGVSGGSDRERQLWWVLGKEERDVYGGWVGGLGVWKSMEHVVEAMEKPQCMFIRSVR